MTGGTYRETLKRPGLQAFLWTQFLGAFNDNVCKIVVTFLTIGHFTAGLTTTLEIGKAATTGAALVGAVFILPFLLFSGYAGHLADVVSKRKVLIWTKVLEIVAMAAMFPALVLSARGVMWPVLAVLFLMAAQSTFFSPAKYGLIPEALPAEDLSRANGLLEMSTFVAIVLGTVIGGEAFEAWRGEPLLTGSVLTVIAVVGTITSFWIPSTAPAKTHQRFSMNPMNEIGRGFARLASDRNLFMTVMAISFFWFLGALIQLTVLPFGQEELHVGEAASTRLFTALAIGIGFGSLVAGRLSGDRIELGLVPVGGFGMGIFSLALVWAVPSYWLCAASLTLVGFTGGWFAVPLNALLQHLPDENEKGRILATNNVANTVGILLASAVLYVCGKLLGMSGSAIIALGGVLTLIATVYILTVLPDFFVRFTLWMLTHTVYRIKVVGRPNIPQRGPALIIANHVSMVDGALVGACVQRFVRFLVWGPHFRKPGIHALMKRLHAIPVTAGNKREVVEAIERARAELAAGHVVCIFVEGAVSRTGNLLPFKHGFERIVSGLDVPVIPVYLDRVWGSVFSFKRGKFFWKLPERLPYPVTVAWGGPLPSSTTALDARLALMELGSEAMTHRRRPTDLLHTVFMRVAKRRWRHLAMADSTGQRLTFGRTLVGSMLLGDVIRRRTDGQDMVGLLLPASVGGALANIAVLMAARVPVNLNFTTGPDALSAAIAQAGITTILTSKQFLSKAGIARSAGHGVPRGPPRRGHGRGEGPCAAGRAPGADLPAAPPVRRPRPGERRGHDHLLERQHRRAERRHAHARQHPGQRGQPRPDLPDGAAATASSACCRSSIRSGSRARCGSRCCRPARRVYHPNPMDAKTIGELAGSLSREHAHQHADILQLVPAALPARTIRAPEIRHRRRGEAARTAGGRVRAAVWRAAARGLRLHGNGAGHRR